MNSFSKASIAAALLATSGLMSSVVIAGPGHKHDSKNHQQKMLFKKLELTEEQRAQVKVEREQKLALKKQSQEKLRNIKKEVRELMQAEVLDKSRLDTLLQQEAAVKAARMAQQHESSKRFKAMLTDEQAARHAVIKEQRQAKRQLIKEQRQDRKDARKARKEALQERLNNRTE
ncbi:Spy/CpxP family protein refolding chaperone [Kangiella sp. HZ709]|uniref:Spy/CpxP family protein refolding chaperone n=1 Tax=Kangiella sp. HZ709 TaxID=2666328 RepID=UPI0012AF4A88|nr:periplasmic heavy metal sensor [Kangiella sp. HZ709]MRX27699.1 periplasmic heavy metal sensor [Kangiella sp. HZ709]